MDAAGGAGARGAARGRALSLLEGSEFQEGFLNLSYDLPPSCLTPQLISSGVAQEADNTPSSVRGRSGVSRARCTFLTVTFSSQMLVSPGRQRAFEPELLSAGVSARSLPLYLLDKARPCPGHVSALNQLQPARAELVS